MNTIDIPFWIFLVVAGIIISAYMVVRTEREEKMIEKEIIEKEGEIYMERLEKAREGKKKTQNAAE